MKLPPFLRVTVDRIDRRFISSIFVTSKETQKEKETETGGIRSKTRTDKEMAIPLLDRKVENVQKVAGDDEYVPNPRGPF